MTAQDNSRLWVLVPSGDRPGPTEPAGETLASLVLIEPLAHVRGPVPGLSIRANGRQATLAPVQENSARARGLHPRQFAPGGGELRARLYEPLAHVRGGGLSPRQTCRMAAQDNSRGLHPGQFAPMGGKLRLRLCKRIAHVRGGCTPGNSRLGAVSCAHACTNRWRTCAAGVSSGQRSLGANSRGAGPPVA